MPEPQKLKIEKRDHPFGERGIRSSLEEVAKRIKAGVGHPKVMTWSAECLERARKEEKLAADTERERAEILLRAVQKKLWIPDPVATEWMAGAHLMACDRSTKDELCVAPIDCDDHCILLGACLMSVGLYVMVCGHGYKGNQISHVLLLVRVNGEWLYADPSVPTMPLGTCTKFTRERWLSLPEIKVVCDSNLCMTDRTKRLDPEKNGFVEQGMFVGVDGPPRIGLAWLVEPKPSQQIEWIAPPARRGPRIVGLGAGEVDVAIDVVNACKGLSREELKDCAVAGARAGGKYLCEAYGGAIVADLCGSIAAEIAGPLYDFAADAWESIFGDDSAEQELARRAAESAQFYAQQKAVNELEATLYARANEIDQALVAMDMSIQPHAGGNSRTMPRLTVLDARVLMAQMGLETYANSTCSELEVAKNGPVAVHDACLGIPHLLTWWGGPPAQRQPFAEVMKKGNDWLLQLEEAKKKASAAIVANAAANEAAQAEGGVRPGTQLRGGGGSGLGAVAVAGLLIGAVAWAALS